MRQQELDGFIDGLFDQKKRSNFPERAIVVLAPSRNARVIVPRRTQPMNETKPGRKDMETTLRTCAEITKNAEHEMNERCCRAPRLGDSCFAGSHAETDAATKSYAPNAGYRM